MKISLLIALGVALLAVFSTTETNTPAAANSQNTVDNPRTKHFRLNSDRVAIDGYDPVSYFAGGPQKGKSKLAWEYNDVIYYFASAENLKTFKANPEKYEPVWGGWCGHAMALRGEKVEINPTCYKIVNGRNVLFFKSFYANALTNWEKEIKKTPENTLMNQGDDFWKKTLETK